MSPVLSDLKPGFYPEVASHGEQIAKRAVAEVFVVNPTQR
jgi:hypothetical protein